MPRPSPKLVQQVFEARYERGYRYLDRCGEVMIILEDLLRKTTEYVWMQEEMKPQGARMKCPELDITVVFDTARMCVDQNPVDNECNFGEISKQIFEKISSKFGIESIVRFGGRQVFILAVDSVDEADKKSVKMAPFKDWPAAPADGMQFTKCEATSVYENEDRSVGIRFSTKPVFRVGAPLQIDPKLTVPPRMLPEGQHKALIAQLQRRKTRKEDPVAGLIIDIDYYMIKPADLTVETFWDKAMEEAESLKRSFLRERRS